MHVARRLARLGFRLTATRESFYDEGALRRTALHQGVLAVTTLTGANATVAGIEALKRGGDRPRSLQSMHPQPRGGPRMSTGPPLPAPSVLEAIGNTPLVLLGKVAP